MKRSTLVTYGMLAPGIAVFIAVPLLLHTLLAPKPFGPLATVALVVSVVLATTGLAALLADAFHKD